MRADCCQISTGPPQGPSPICYTKPSLTVYPGAYAHALRRDLRGTPSVEEAAALTPSNLPLGICMPGTYLSYSSVNTFN